MEPRGLSAETGHASPPSRSSVGPAPLQVSPLQLGSLRVDPPLLLAPMAGITDQGFRRILRRIGGAGLVSMEFVPSKGLVWGDEKVLRTMAFSAEERPLAIQIYGSDPGTMAEAARRVDELEIDVCDINMGCPANKVLSGCAGAALMGDLRLAQRIIAAVRRSTRHPVTVKFRLGLDERRQSYLELGRICQDLGVAAITLHGRTARQMFTGRADWDAIARLKDAVEIPVIGNGDVEGAADALAMFRQTGCDGVMIGRAATANPWIFRQVVDGLAGEQPKGATDEDRAALILDHFHAVLADEEPREALHKLRVFSRWYSRGFARGVHLRRQIGEWQSADEAIARVRAFLDEPGLEDAA